MGKIQAKSIFRLVPLIGDLGRFLWAFTLNNSARILSFATKFGMHVAHVEGKLDR